MLNIYAQHLYFVQGVMACAIQYLYYIHLISILYLFFLKKNDWYCCCSSYDEEEGVMWWQNMCAPAALHLNTVLADFS